MQSKLEIDGYPANKDAIIEMTIKICFSSIKNYFEILENEVKTSPLNVFENKFMMAYKIMFVAETCERLGMTHIPHKLWTSTLIKISDKKIDDDIAKLCKFMPAENTSTSTSVLEAMNTKLSNNDSIGLVNLDKITVTKTGTPKDITSEVDAIAHIGTLKTKVSETLIGYALSKIIWKLSLDAAIGKFETDMYNENVDKLLKACSPGLYVYVTPPRTVKNIVHDDDEIETLRRYLSEEGARDMIDAVSENAGTANGAFKKFNNLVAVPIVIKELREKYTGKKPAHKKIIEWFGPNGKLGYDESDVVYVLVFNGNIDDAVDAKNKISTKYTLKTSSNQTKSIAFGIPTKLTCKYVLEMADKLANKSASAVTFDFTDAFDSDSLSAAIKQSKIRTRSVDVITHKEVENSESDDEIDEITKAMDTLNDRKINSEDLASVSDSDEENNDPAVIQESDDEDVIQESDEEVDNRKKRGPKVKGFLKSRQ